MRHLSNTFRAMVTLLVVLLLGACRGLAPPPATAPPPTSAPLPTATPPPTATPLPTAAPSPTAAPQSGLEGLWTTDGYGYLIEIEGDQLQIYEVTAVSCIASLAGELQRDDLRSGADEQVEAWAQIPFEGFEMILQVLPAASPDEKRFQWQSTSAPMLAQRTAERPQICAAPQAETAEATFDVLWQTYLEHYPFFAMKEVDWTAVRAEFRPQITDDTTQKELFKIFEKMIEPLGDGHTFFIAPSLHKQFFGTRPDQNPVSGEDEERIEEIVQTYLRSPLGQWVNGRLAFAMLDGDVGYLRIWGFQGYTDEGDFQTGLEALETALDEIFGGSEDLKGLVIDVRLTGGGSDRYGLAIASRLTEREYLAYIKQARNDPADPDRWTEGQTSLVQPSNRPGYFGPVILLTGPENRSAGETFTMALMGRTPEVIRIGQNTYGVFSDVIDRPLPNGWQFGLPNERYLTEDGRSFDGTGIPPDIEVPLFTPGDLEAGKDGALDKALEFLRQK